MKTIVTLLLLAALNLVAEESDQERDFISRLAVFQKAGDMAVEKVQTVYEIGDTPGSELMSMYQRLEALVVRGIKRVKFEEIYPPLQERMKKPTKIDCEDYTPNLKPYKMVEIKFETPIKNGSAGISLLTGIRDGKIYICGYKKAG